MCLDCWTNAKRPVWLEAASDEVTAITGGVSLPGHPCFCKTCSFFSGRRGKPLQTFEWMSGMCLVAQACPTLENPLGCSPPGSSVHGIFQVKTLKWVDVSSSRGSSPPRDRTQISCVSLTAGRFFTPGAMREAHEWDDLVSILKELLWLLCWDWTAEWVSFLGFL